MAVLPIALTKTVPPSFHWPLQFFIANVLVSYVLSVVTGNVSQVDRVWTFVPTIYTAYFALLPLWPHKQMMLLWPYTPEKIEWKLGERYSPRALLMFGLVVSHSISIYATSMLSACAVQFIWMCRYATRISFFDLLCLNARVLSV